MEALLVLLVLVPGHEVARLFVEERLQDPGLGVLLVRVAFCREALVEFARQVAENAPPGGIDAVHSHVLDFEPVDRTRCGGRPGQDGGLVPVVTPAVAERELDQLRVDLAPRRSCAGGGSHAQRRVVGRRQVEAGLPGVQDRDDARVVEVAGGLPPVEVPDEWRDELAQVAHVARRVIDGAEAIGQDGHLGQVVVFVLGVEARL